MQNQEDAITNLNNIKRALSQAINSPKAILRRAETGCGKYGNRYGWIDEQLMTKGIYNNAADECEQYFGVRPFEPVAIPEIAYPTEKDIKEVTETLKCVKAKINEYKYLTNSVAFFENTKEAYIDEEALLIAE